MLIVKHFKKLKLNGSNTTSRNNIYLYSQSKANENRGKGESISKTENHTFNF